MFFDTTTEFRHPTHIEQKVLVLPCVKIAKSLGRADWKKARSQPQPSLLLCWRRKKDCERYKQDGEPWHWAGALSDQFNGLSRAAASQCDEELREEDISPKSLRAASHDLLNSQIRKDVEQAWIIKNI